MTAISATEARKTLSGLIQQVNDDHIVILQARQHF